MLLQEVSEPSQELVPQANTPHTDVFTLFLHGLNKPDVTGGRVQSAFIPRSKESAALGIYQLRLRTATLRK